MAYFKHTYTAVTHIVKIFLSTQDCRKFFRAKKLGNILRTEKEQFMVHVLHCVICKGAVHAQYCVN